MSRSTFARTAGALLAVGVAVAVVAWFALGPDARVPVHVGFDGAVRLGGRTEAVLIGPAGMLLMLAVGLLPERRGSREPRSPRVLLAAMAVLLVLHVVVVTGSLGVLGA